MSVVKCEWREIHVKCITKWCPRFSLFYKVRYHDELLMLEVNPAETLFMISLESWEIESVYLQILCSVLLSSKVLRKHHRGVFPNSARACGEADGVRDRAGKQPHVSIFARSSHPLGDRRLGRSALASLPGKRPLPSPHLLLHLFSCVFIFGSVTMLIPFVSFALRCPLINCRFIFSVSAALQLFF